MAQEYFTVGPKAGFNVNSLQDLRGQDQIRFNDFSTISAGAFGRLNLGKLYVQPEVYFLVKGANFRRTDGSGADGKIRISTLDAPVLLGYYVLQSHAFNLRAFAGPVFNLHSKETHNDLRAWDPERYSINRNVNSLQAGIGADFMMFTVDARYEYGLSRFNSLAGMRPTQFTISLGYKLFGQ